MKKTEIIETKLGKINGYCENGLEIFKGVPYAEPPVGDLRLRPPVAKIPWNDVLDATEYGPCSFQGYSQLEEWFGKPQPESEDCLISIFGPQHLIIINDLLCSGYMEEHLQLERGKIQCIVVHHWQKRMWSWLRSIID